jgi:hypothetical protein
LIRAGDVSLNPGPVVHDQYNRNSLFSFCTINCRSILSNPRKLYHIKALAETYDYSIIALTETWLDDTVEDYRISINGYNAIRLDRNSNGGGVALYIKNELITKCLGYLSDDVIEALWILINLKVKIFYSLFTTVPKIYLKMRRGLQLTLITFKNALTALMTYNQMLK